MPHQRAVDVGGIENPVRVGAQIEQSRGLFEGEGVGFLRETARGCAVQTNHACQAVRDAAAVSSGAENLHGAGNADVALDRVRRLEKDHGQIPLACVGNQIHKHGELSGISKSASWVFYTKPKYIFAG